MKRTTQAFLESKQQAHSELIQLSKSLEVLLQSIERRMESATKEKPLQDENKMQKS